MPSPRVLTMTFEFHVPEGLNTNVRATRIETAVSNIKTAVQGLAATVFPWADRLVVRHEWSYRWQSATDEIALPATNENTPEDAT